MIGDVLKYDEALSGLERCYVRLFGAPISGLKIRCRRILPSIPGGLSDILDVGCGTGVFTMEIAKRFPAARVVGIDNVSALTEKCKSIAHRSGLSNCTFLTMDALRMSFQKQFDLVLCIDNLEHIEDDLAVLKGIHDSLKEQGAAIIHVPNYLRRWFFTGWRVNFDVAGHVRPGYPWSELMDKLKATGFVIERASYTYGLLENLTNNISYLITRAERRNKHLYALLFPLLDSIAFLGRNSRPKMGAGILAIARKHESTP